MVKSTKLYEMLGVEPKATHVEVLKGYRLRALRVHPDKNKDDPNATENFQQLQKAFDVLRDPKKRRLYDQTGCSEETSVEFMASYDYYRNLFSTVTPEDIESFKGRYKDSVEERDDLVEFYESKDGDISKIFECVILAEPDDADRFLNIFRGLIAKKVIVSTKKFESSSAQLPKTADKWRRKFAKEEKNLRGCSASSGDSDMASLVLSIQANRNKKAVEAAEFLDAIEAKYSREGKTKKARKSNQTSDAQKRRKV